MEKLLGNWGAKILVTRITAAIFHGVYIGYYIFFLLSYVITIGIDSLREVLPTREKLENKSSFHAFALSIFWAMFVNFVSGFTTHWATNLNTKQVINLMKSVHWIPILMSIAMIGIAKILKVLRLFNANNTDKKISLKPHSSAIHREL